MGAAAFPHYNWARRGRNATEKLSGRLGERRPDGSSRLGTSLGTTYPLLTATTPSSSAGKGIPRTFRGTVAHPVPSTAESPERTRRSLYSLNPAHRRCLGTG